MKIIFTDLPLAKNDIQLEIPNDKLDEVVECYGIDKSDFKTASDCFDTFIGIIISKLKNPIMCSKMRKQSKPDISDLIQVK